jgi:hypothetical protein
MQTIKAIPTVYRGIVFRSRNEARWAVFLDELDIDWIYEPEGWELREPHEDGRPIRYIPDFYLPNDQMFFEVKRAFETVTEDETIRAWQKCSLLAEASRVPVILAGGPPAYSAHWVTRGPCRLKEQRGGCSICDLTAEACDDTYSWHSAAFVPGSVRMAIGDTVELTSEEKRLLRDSVDVALTYDFSSVPFDPDITWRTS